MASLDELEGDMLVPRQRHHRSLQLQDIGIAQGFQDGEGYIVDSHRSVM